MARNIKKNCAFLLGETNLRGTHMIKKTTGESAETGKQRSKLKLRYGELADEYAETREETARALGDDGRADQWERIKESLRPNDGD